MKRRCTHASGRTGRRLAIAAALSLAALTATTRARSQRDAGLPRRRWYEAASAMKRLAESWGDQPYGAVVVLDESLIGAGPSRVIRNNDPSAHAEREAIRDARRKTGRRSLSGAVLYSTSRPCSACEAAAAEAEIARMYFGPSLTDAGVPGSSVR
jgi:tRNA(adenine34) deaminase